MSFPTTKRVTIASFHQERFNELKNELSQTNKRIIIIKKNIEKISQNTSGINLSFVNEYYLSPELEILKQNLFSLKEKTKNFKIKYPYVK